MYYFDILKALHESGTDYLLVGGLAVNLYGAPRVTQDMDLVLAMRKDNILKFNRVLEELGYVPRLPVNPDDLADEAVRGLWIREKNMKAFSYYHSRNNYRVIDVVLLYNTDYETLKRGATVKKAAGVDIHLVGIDDLIEMKRFSGRAQDLSDIVILEKIKSFTDGEMDREG